MSTAPQTLYGEVPAWAINDFPFGNVIYKQGVGTGTYGYILENEEDEGFSETYGTTDGDSLDFPYMALEPYGNPCDNDEGYGWKSYVNPDAVDIDPLVMLAWKVGVDE